MELIQAIQSLELTYRLAIAFGVLFWVWHWNREWIGQRIEYLPEPIYDWVATANGAYILITFSMMSIGIIRFGVQIIFGV